MASASRNAAPARKNPNSRRRSDFSLITSSAAHSAISGNAAMAMAVTAASFSMRDNGNVSATSSSQIGRIAESTSAYGPARQRGSNQMNKAKAATAAMPI